MTIEQLAQNITVTTDVSRVITVSEELKLEVGQVIDNVGHSWSDLNDDNLEQEFTPETDEEIKYIFTAKNVSGYKVQYFDYDDLFNKYYIDENMSEDEADKLASKLSEDEEYLKIMDLIGSDGSMKHECEVLVSNKQQFKIVEINDGRDDVGYIEVILETLN